MKKLSVILLAFVMAVLSCVSVFAAGINSAEQSVLNNMRIPADMNGKAVYVPVSYINQAEAHFNTIDMTDAQAAQINGIISEGRSFLENSGESSIENLSSSQKRTLLSYASAAAGVLELTAVAGSDKTRIKITTKDGSVIVDDSNSVIKTTGSSSIALSAVLLSIIACALVFSASGSIILKKRAKTQ